MEYKSFDFTLTNEPVELGKGEWIIEGYASTRNIDNGNDRVIKDAFIESIKTRFTEQKAKNGKSKIKVLWQHDPSEIIGQLLETYEDDDGLFVKIKIIKHPAFKTAERAYILAQLGEIDSFSIGYKVLEDKKVKENGREIRELIKVKWYEVSLVTFPMNELAEFTTVKEEDEMDEKILEAINGLTEQVSLALKTLAESKTTTEEVLPEPVVEEVKETEVPEKAEEKKADDLVIDVKFNVKELEDVFTKFREDILTEVKSLLTVQEEKAMMKCKDCGSTMECKKCSKEDIIEEIDPTCDESMKSAEAIEDKNAQEVSEEAKNNSDPENSEEDYLDFLLTKEFKF